MTNEGQSPHHAWEAPPLRLASVAGDNAFGDVDVGANVGKGQNFGLTTPKPRIVFDETKLADAAFSFIHGVPTKVLKRDYGAPRKFPKRTRTTPTRPSRLPMNPIRMQLMNIIIIIFIIIIIIIIIILPLPGRLDPCQVHDPASNLPCTAGRLDPL